MKHYVLLVEDDIEPFLIGPYDEDFVRDDEARDLKSEHGDQSGIFTLDVEPNGDATVASYSGGFFQSPLGWPIGHQLIDRLKTSRGTSRGRRLLTLYQRAEILRVTELMEHPNTFFVFGSNLAGIHGGGAAKVAREQYGAIKGIGSGQMGRCYALPTKDRHIESLTLHDVRTWVEQFKMDAWDAAPTARYAVTRVGCGLAVFTDEDIAPMFVDAPINCLLPIGWRSFNNEPEAEA